MAYGSVRLPLRRRIVAAMPNDPVQITYAIASRLMTTGEVSIVMHLYRDGQHALMTTLMTCNRDDLPGTLRTCRAHLDKLGIREIPRMPSVASQ